MQGKFQLNVVPNAGHLLQEDQPTLVAEQLLAFLQRHHIS
jgi:pimeloyl-ACP methyl ester carboxylesterase